MGLLVASWTPGLRLALTVKADTRETYGGVLNAPSPVTPSQRG